MGGAQTTEESGRWQAALAWPVVGWHCGPIPTSSTGQAVPTQGPSLFAGPRLEGESRMDSSPRDGGPLLLPKSSQERHRSSDNLHGVEAQSPRLGPMGAEREGAWQVKTGAEM